jgi:SAM-dependent methyltransferase
MTDFVEEQKQRERRLREASIPYGEFTRQKTVWWGLITLDAVLTRLRLPRGARLLDAGCSDGRIAACLRSRGRADIFYVGTDFAFNPLKGMRGRGVGTHAVCADAAKPLFKEKVFDAAVSLEVLHHLASQEARRGMLRNIFSVLRPGGHLIVTVVNRPSWAALVANGVEGPLLTSPDLYVHLYDPAGLTADLESSGFRVKDVVAINNLPVRYLKRMGFLGVPIDGFITRCFKGLSFCKGRYLLAVCERPRG